MNIRSTDSEKVSLIVVDWGSTSFRIAALSISGNVISRKESSHGVKNLRHGDFASLLSNQLGRLKDLHVPIVLCGMIGSKGAWFETPYVQAPCELEEICKKVRHEKVDGLNLYFVPGVKYSNLLHDDVMRGEETQIIGGDFTKDSIVVLPGTHSKWTQIGEGGKIERFQTFMTGDLFSAVSQNTVLKLCATDTDIQNKYNCFMSGVKLGFDSDSLTSVLFSVRTKFVFDDQKVFDSFEYLSGLLIGNEIRAGVSRFRHHDAQGAIKIVAEPMLGKRYISALHFLDIEGDYLELDAAFNGCFRVAKELKIL